MRCEGRRSRYMIIAVVVLRLRLFDGHHYCCILRVLLHSGCHVPSQSLHEPLYWPVLGGCWRPNVVSLAPQLVISILDLRRLFNRRSSNTSENSLTYVDFKATLVEEVYFLLHFGLYTSVRVCLDWRSFVVFRSICPTILYQSLSYIPSNYPLTLGH